MSVSESLFDRAKNVIPGGVNSPVRAFGQVGGIPRFISSADGAYVTDVDGKQYLDFVGSWGPMVLGHNSAVVREAVAEALNRGTSYGAPTALEVEFAELLTQLCPGLEMVRLVSSGTEAAMSAVRLARGATGRDIIIKFNGHYHGHSDSLLVAAGSGVATCGIAGSRGVPEKLAELCVSIEFNDLALLQQTVEQIGPERIALIALEPVAGNMGLVLPQKDFLVGVRKLCDQHGIVLLFDEVMTGFRVSLGGAAERFGVVPDMLCYGKVIGGGLPVGAFGGRRDIMQQLAPLGPVYQAGTLSGNPLAVTAGLAVLRYLEEHNPYPALEEMAAQFSNGMRELGMALGIPITATHCGSMIGFFFSEREVHDFATAKLSDIERFKKYFWGMLDEGVYLAPSAFEAGFLGTAHTPVMIEQMLSASERVLKRL